VADDLSCPDPELPRVIYLVYGSIGVNCFGYAGIGIATVGAPRVDMSTRKTLGVPWIFMEPQNAVGGCVLVQNDGDTLGQGAGERIVSGAAEPSRESHKRLP
jgi:hypothetical protein